MRPNPDGPAADRPPFTGNSLAVAQGAYLVVTGLWPLAHMRSFEAVTGPKTDRWLVVTVGALLGVIGGVLLRAGRREAVSPEMRLLATGSASTLAAIDCLYVARRRISPVYLLDAALEAGLLAAWAGTRHTRPNRPRRSSRQYRFSDLAGSLRQRTPL